MNDTVIEVRNLSKKYRLGVLNHGMLYKDLQSWWARLRGKEDPHSVIGHEHKRVYNGDFWALDDVSFDVKRGDIVGVIGRNGAGKSTLLKIISHLTTPTTGSIRIKGRVASLLEVGTGFHPELTGRENVFLNGSILGMRRHEIQRKFDEIVAFAGVDDFIDTPVKRYSSGMYVRLAFAVAAHLESEILIVDEVLAVGDLAFQKKCLGKMGDVSKSGRTVLFVSHNLIAMKMLCNHGIILEGGSKKYDGTIAQAVRLFMHEGLQNQMRRSWSRENAPRTEHIALLNISVSNTNASEADVIETEKDICIKFHFEHLQQLRSGSRHNVSLVLYTADDVPVFNVFSEPLSDLGTKITGSCIIAGGLLNTIQYSLRLLVVENETVPLFDMNNLLSFEPTEAKRSTSWHGNWIGSIHPKLLTKWEINGKTA